MKKKKLRFNIIDALILIILVAAIALLGYIFVFSDDTEAPKEVHTVEYVFVVERVNKNLYDNAPIKNGDPVYVPGKNNIIGYVCKEPESINSYDLGFDPVEKKEVYFPREDMVDLYITVRCSAEKSDWGYSISGTGMPVGDSKNFIIGNMAVTTTTIEMSVLD